MDSGSSLYMCSPCCQLFGSLEEVLSHQLTCHSEDPGEEAPPAAPPGPQTESLVLYQCADLQPPHPDPAQHPSPASAPQSRPSPRKPSGSPRQSPAQGAQRQPALSSAPLIRYQCGDCGCLFESLGQWQQHRKLGQCTRAGSEPGGEGAATAGEGEVKMEEQLEEGGEEQPDQAEGSAMDGARQDEGGEDGDRGGGAWQEDCAWKERLVCQDHSYLPSAGEKQEEDEQARGEESVASQAQGEGPAAEDSGRSGLQADSGSQPAEKAQAAGEGEPGAADHSFLCVCCGTGFSSEPALVAHRRTRHGLEEALHHCPVCGESFMNTTLFLYHRRQHREQEEGPGAGAGARPGGRATSAKRVLGLLPSTAPSGGAKKQSSSGSSPSQTSLSGPAAGATVDGDERLEGGGNGAPATQSPPSPAPASSEAGSEAGLKRPAAPHTCPHCGRAFKRRCHLLAHVYSHTGSKRYSCETCDKAFSYKSNLARHRHTHACAKPYSCERCGKTFTQSGTLKQHWLIHAKADALSQGADGKGVAFQLPHPCTDCSSSFKTRTQLLIHRHVHTGQYPFSCTVCGQTFLRRKQLQLHSLKHQGKEPISCPRCSTQFLNQTLLDNHLQRCLGKAGRGRGRSAGQLECDMCGHRCVTQEGLDLHRLSHTGQTPLRCPLAPCRRRFASSSALEEHVLAHCQAAEDPDSRGPAPKPRPFHCEHCGKDFTTASSLSVHLRIHTGERPYQCTQCGKRFRQIPHLRDHERLHSGARPFSCSVCGKSFVLAARLAEHARTHSGDKPYTCPLCPRAFRSLSNLGKHRKTHGRPAPAREPAGEGEAAVRTILLVQAAPPAPEGGDAQAAPAHSQLLLLHPSVTVGEGQEGEVLMPHAFQVIVEETV
ncbi:zinc finger protein 665-like [Anguilla rostrata]|uniref:zinc finger protein 665-like n=1 Tax=Anguilla rostrata TaxID=7938 RepID=UPI0030D387F1